MRHEFEFEKDNIIEYLGRQNFEDVNGAIYEIIKNAYDAHATSCKIRFAKDKIIIEDDGYGMSEDDIKNYWMKIGKSHKKDLENGRVIAGNKGIGKLALTRIGRTAKIETSKENNNPVLWVTDWKSSEFKDSFIKKKGTLITIDQLHDSWNRELVKKLDNYLCKVIRKENFNVTLYFEDEIYQISNSFDELKKTINAPLYFSFKITKSTLDISIENKIFKDIVFEKYTNLPKIRNISAPLKEFDFLNEENIPKIKDINGEFYFDINKSQGTADRFLYSEINSDIFGDIATQDRGIILYRNEFSINGYEGSSDWTRLQSRVAKSPATATHPNGSYRFRKQNIFGIINIDKVKNRELEDLSNRQGLVKNDIFNILMKIIYFVFNDVEKYYQGIIRDIDSNNKANNMLYSSKDIMDVSIPQIMSEIEKEVNTLKKGKNISSEEIKKIVIFEKNKENEEKIKTLDYNNAILEVFATQSVLINSVTHDFRNDLKNVPIDISNVIKKLKKTPYWSEFESIEYTKYKSTNIIKNLDESHEASNRTKFRLNRFLSNIRKDRLEIQEINLIDYFEQFKEYWKYLHPRVNIQVDTSGSIFKVDISSLDVIFNNLVDNSIKHAKSNELIISINIKIINEYMNVHYYDNGVGLNSYYSKNIDYIYKPLESSSEKGHGLGMWILKNRVIHLSGEIQETYNEGGFNIKFKVGSYAK